MRTKMSKTRAKYLKALRERRRYWERRGIYVKDEDFKALEQRRTQDLPKIGLKDIKAIATPLPAFPQASEGTVARAMRIIDRYNRAARKANAQEISITGFPRDEANLQRTTAKFANRGAQYFADRDNRMLENFFKGVRATPLFNTQYSRVIEALEEQLRVKGRRWMIAKLKQASRENRTLFDSYFDSDQGGLNGNLYNIIKLFELDSLLDDPDVAEGYDEEEA